jgi:hypothetical protein
MTGLTVAFHPVEAVSGSWAELGDALRDRHVPVGASSCSSEPNPARSLLAQGGGVWRDRVAAVIWADDPNLSAADYRRACPIPSPFWNPARIDLWDPTRPHGARLDFISSAAFEKLLDA